MPSNITIAITKIIFIFCLAGAWRSAKCQSLMNIAQNSSAETVEFLVQLNAGTTPADLLMNLNAYESIRIVRIDNIVSDWRIYKITIVADEFSKAQIKDQMQKLISVHAVQYNERALERNLPDDAEWPLQTNLQQINAPYAWHNATGGTTEQGDTIVVAVLEKGLLKTHPDLTANLWRNYAEIPNNKIDDDQNGYTDDYFGWDVEQQGDGAGNGSSHGTSVCGIIGARGDNQIGIAGINWMIKMMAITNVAYEDQIIAAHYYAYRARKLYNSSRGKQGTFVVAVNVSFGFDQKFVKDHPLWCAVYDSLLTVGVLGCGATNNRHVNVDVVGDIPTTCPSLGLIAVTAVGPKEEWRNSGYGAKSIDLAAPGVAYTTVNGSRNDGDYANFPGTSAATPHVSGAVALLYSLPCPDLTQDALTAPAACAARIRDLILDNTVPNPLLAGITVTGGRLDLKRSIEAVVQRCGQDVSGPVAITQITPNPADDRLEVHLQFPDDNPGVIFIHNMLGQVVHSAIISPIAFGPTRNEINIRHWPAGCYALSFAAGQTSISKMFVKI